MKRRLKLTPFAKLFIVAVIFFGARYVYLHQEELISNDFFNFDYLKKGKDNKVNKPENKKNNTDIRPDTLIINIVRKSNAIKIITAGKSILIPYKDTDNSSKKLLFDISKKKKVVGKIIVN